MMEKIIEQADKLEAAAKKRIIKISQGKGSHFFSCLFLVALSMLLIVGLIVAIFLILILRLINAAIFPLFILSVVALEEPAVFFDSDGVAELGIVIVVFVVWGLFCPEGFTLWGVADRLREVIEKYYVKKAA